MARLHAALLDADWPAVLEYALTIFVIALVAVIILQMLVGSPAVSAP